MTEGWTESFTISPSIKSGEKNFFKMSAAVMIGTLRIKICTGPHILGGIKSYIHSPNAVCHKNFFAGEKSILNFHL